MAKKNSMGRGLDAIFNENSADTSDRVTVININSIEPNAAQPRKTFTGESLEELSSSIAAHGIIQPIIVRSAGDGFYKIIAGERRYRAAKMAGLSEIPAQIMELDEKEASEIAIIENIQRENLNPYEEALAYKSLIEAYGLTQEQLSQRIGKSRSSIANMLRILDLPDEVLAFVADGKISTGHAKVILSLKDKNDLLPCAERIYNLSLSVRAAETLVKKLNSALDEPEDIEPEQSKDEKSYYESLKKHIFSTSGRRVAISTKKKKLEISYEDNEDLEEIIRTLCGNDIFQNLI